MERRKFFWSLLLSIPAIYSPAFLPKYERKPLSIPVFVTAHLQELRDSMCNNLGADHSSSIDSFLQPVEVLSLMGNTSQYQCMFRNTSGNVVEISKGERGRKCIVKTI